ncbi:putative sugar nucleotidyl transferase [Ferruginibacter paludis]|uniref:putative sugar nucleotidyl transferase n=1 Tax=Ferruginibacter paludis TaxID=1310417 RepID=UPI0025B50852|nr:putative sugar nucleotidyl transferase [Ferruginibacter paludis]MDN3657516.1 putative sugar nucleotidyl transferase [Ferruginibacter paludis]
MTAIPGDDLLKGQLYPFTATRSVADIRVGILTIREKWSLIEAQDDASIEYSLVPSNIIPTKDTGSLIAASYAAGKILAEHENIKSIQRPWDIFLLNGWALQKDFELITKGRYSARLSTSNRAISPSNIFIEEGAVIEHSIINATTGPVYIGKNAEVMEGCMIRGPFALCEGAVLKMGSKIYGATTIGPYCTAGGEIKNSVMFANSNKGHDGYLGDSVIGEWCNLGGGTTTSNIKNTAGTVRVWSNKERDYIGMGLKCGLLMGDYSRAAINTSFNTGTVVGVCCNIFGEGFPPKLVNDFSWGKERYSFEKALQDISNWKKLKGAVLTPHEKKNLEQLYNQ